MRETDDRDSLLIALVENVARENLSPVEEARAYAVLQDEFGLALGEVAERVGRSKPAMSNRMRLLDLPRRRARARGTGGADRRTCPGPYSPSPTRTASASWRGASSSRALSVRAAERAARRSGAKTKPRKRAPVDPALAARARHALERLTGAAVHLRETRLEVHFADEAELEEIVEGLEAGGRI